MKSKFFAFCILSLLLMGIFFSADSYRRPGPLNLRVGTSYTPLVLAENEPFDRDIYHDDPDKPMTLLGDAGRLHLRYWKNTITYYSTPFLSHGRFKGYAVFSLDGKLLAYDAEPLLDPSLQKEELETYGFLWPGSDTMLHLVDPAILEEEFPLSWRELREKYGPWASSANGGMKTYVLTDGRWLQLRCTSEYVDSASDTPIDEYVNNLLDQTWYDINFVFDPFTLHRTHPVEQTAGFYTEDLYMGEHPFLPPESRWKSDTCHAELTIAANNESELGRGCLTIDNREIPFVLYSTWGGWRYATFVPLDPDDNPTTWAFQGEFEPIADGFRFSVHDSYGYLPSRSAVFDFYPAA